MATKNSTLRYRTSHDYDDEIHYARPPQYHWRFCPHCGKRLDGGYHDIERCARRNENEDAWIWVMGTILLLLLFIVLLVR